MLMLRGTFFSCKLLNHKLFIMLEFVIVSIMGMNKRKITAVTIFVTTIFIFGASTVFALSGATVPSAESVLTDNINDQPVGDSAEATQSNQEGAKVSSTTAVSQQAIDGQAQPTVQNKQVESGLVMTRSGNTTVVTDGTGWLATFTDGARTVSMRGSQRTFSEPGAVYTVTHNVWVRLLEAPFKGVIDEAWLQSKVSDTSLDALGIAMQYISGVPTLTDASNRTYASDADYGPIGPDGIRQEGSDFNDYLGVDYDYNGVSDSYEIDQLGALDCSGYMRMIWGYRLGMKLTNQADGMGVALPRRAVQMYASGPGVATIAQGSDARANMAKLQPGDLVFSDASTDDGTAIDHVGLYLGKDSAGNYRFISSRKTANGPTMSDIGGKSVLNGIGLYAKSFVAARRL